MQKNLFTNLYCGGGGCQCTTKHEIREAAFSCTKCGSLKYPTQKKSDKLKKVC